jgi:hypothetical protein
MIPKWHIKNISSLKSDDKKHLELARHLSKKGLELIEEWHPELASKN